MGELYTEPVKIKARQHPEPGVRVMSRRHRPIGRHWPNVYDAFLILAAVVIGGFIPMRVSAEIAVELPALAATGNSPDDTGAFTVKLLWWDQASTPNPIVLKWDSGLVNAFEYGQIRSGRLEQNATIAAFRYAIGRTPGATHTGTVRIQGIAYGSTRMDGSSAGAAMAVGFIALFKGASITHGIAMTGTLQPGGSVGKVGGLRGKIRAAAREGYHTILIPAGQLYHQEWRLQALADSLGVTVKEVATVDEAYRLMTGASIH